MRVSSRRHAPALSKQDKPRIRKVAKKQTRQRTQRVLSPQEKEVLKVKLVAELQAVEQQLPQAYGAQNQAHEHLRPVQREFEQRQWDVLELIEKKAEIKAEFNRYLGALKKELIKAQTRQARANKSLTSALQRRKDKQQVILGLQVRLVRNALLAWRAERSSYSNKVRLRFANQQKLEQEIRILQARYQSIIARIKREERAQEKARILGRRRGRIVSSLDLVALSDQLADFKKLRANQTDEARKLLEENKETYEAKLVSLASLSSNLENAESREQVLQEEIVQLKREYSELSDSRAQLLEKQKVVLEAEAEEARKAEIARAEAIILQRKQEEVRRSELVKTEKAQAKKERDRKERSRLRREDRARNREERRAKLRGSFEMPKLSSSKMKLALQPSFVVFVVAALLVTSTVGVSSYVSRGLGVKGQVLGQATTAYEQLKSAGEAAQSDGLGAAEEDLALASGTFAEAYQETQSLGDQIVRLSSLLPQTSQLRSASEFLHVGQLASEAAIHITQATAAFDGYEPELPEDVLAETEEGAQEKKGEDVAESQVTLTGAIVNARDDLHAANDLLLEANEAMNHVRVKDFPDEYASQVALLKEAFPVTVQAFNQAVNFIDGLYTILGGDQKQRYLLLFQNNTEIRGTGGFIGSFGVVDVDQGNVQNIKIDGIYNPDGQLLERVYPPYPLRLITPRWFMRDANWYPDFEVSAPKIAEFYEKTGGPSVDGIMTFTPTVIQQLLTVTGPIDMPEYDATVNSQNFLEVTQYEVEIDYDKELNRPKQFLADMMPHLLTKLLATNGPGALEVLNILNTALVEKHILIHFFNEELQETVRQNGFAGEVKTPPLDYLSVVNSNILGGKTDSMINESISHEVTITPSGEVFGHVTVERTHTGTYKWPSGDNRDYIRVYVPEGSQLIDATGFEKLEELDTLYPCDECGTDPLIVGTENTIQRFENSHVEVLQEGDKTVFAGWQVLEPQTSETYTVTYKLPFKVDIGFFEAAETYSVYVQKQSGSLGSEYQLEIINEPAYDYALLHPAKSNDVVSVVRDDKITFKTRLNRDRFMAVILQR